MGTHAHTLTHKHPEAHPPLSPHTHKHRDKSRPPPLSPAIDRGYWEKKVGEGKEGFNFIQENDSGRN